MKISFFIQKKDHHGDPSLFEAARMNCLLAVDLIIKYSKSLPNPYIAEQTDVLKWKNFRDETPLYVAVERGFIQIVNLLMTNGASAVEPCIRG